MGIDLDGAKAALIEAYKTWADSKGTDPSKFYALMSPDFTMRSVTDGIETAEFTAPRDNREEAKGYFEALIEDWSMHHYGVETICSNEDDGVIIAFCEAAWEHRPNSKVVDVIKTDIWTFNSDGTAASMREIFDGVPMLRATGYLPEAK